MGLTQSMNRMSGSDFLNAAAFQADTRTDASFAEGDIVGVGGPSGYSLIKVSSGETHETDGGAKFKLLPSVIGYTVEQFGVDGSASAADFSAWDKALNTAIADGVTLNGTPGATYLFDPSRNGRHNTTLQEGQSLRLDLRGATIKFADNMIYTAGKFSHMIHVIMRSIYGVNNATAESVEIRNFTADGNLRGQTDPNFGTSLTEQWSAVKIQAFGADGNRLKRCLIENYTQVDPIADTILIGPSSTDNYDLDGDGYSESATIGSVTLNNGHAGTRNGARAFVALGSGCGDVVINGVTCDIAQGSQNNSIETEFSSIGEQFVNVKMSNIFIDDLEFGGKSGQADQFNVVLNNVETRGFFLMAEGNVRVSNSKLHISLSNTQRIKRFFASNVTFVHAVYDDGGVQNVRKIGMTPPANSIWKETNCHHIIDGALDAGADNALIDTGNSAAADYGTNIYEFDNVTFDPRAPISIDAYAGGLVKTKGCTFGGVKEAVTVGKFSSFAGGWHSDGDDFTNVTGNSFRFIGAVSGTDAEIRIDGGKYNNLDFDVTASLWREMVKQSSRVLLSGSAASGGGLVGDVIQLDDAAYTAAASTDPVMWRCVYSHPNSATWLPILNKP